MLRVTGHVAEGTPLVIRDPVCHILEAAGEEEEDRSSAE